MARQQRSGERPEQVSLRLPKHLAAKVDDFKEKEGTDRSVIILCALRYWLEVDGNVTTDNEFLIRLSHIEAYLSDLQKNDDLFEKRTTKLSRNNIETAKYNRDVVGIS